MPIRLNRKEKTSDNEKRIISAGYEVFVKKGYAAATIPEIANRAGVAVGTIYNYFNGKRELFLAVIREFLISPLLQKAQADEKEKIEELIRNIFQDRLKLIEQEPVSSLIPLMGEIVRDDYLKKMYREKVISPLFKKFEAIYKHCADSGEVKPFQESLVVRAIGGMIIGLYILRIVEGENCPLNRLSEQEIIARLSELILHGMLSTKGRGENAQ